ncbi:MAG: hypothetical protein M3N23_08580 [Pseudomonadota bacterium]|nr:hypothetical protein [Pseudomonadota bacterium]
MAIGVVLLSVLPAANAHSAQVTSQMFRCIEHGNVIYTDRACSDGHAVANFDLRGPTSRREAYSTALAQADSDRQHLAQLQEVRLRAERIEEQRSRRDRAHNLAHQKTCANLALRKKWSEEDAASASRRASKKSKIKMHRAAERYAVECGAEIR